MVEFLCPKILSKMCYAFLPNYEFKTKSPQKLPQINLYWALGGLQTDVQMVDKDLLNELTLFKRYKADCVNI